jgi:hypothetical protein
MELSTDSRKRLLYVAFSVGHTSLESVAELKQFVEASNFKYQRIRFLNIAETSEYYWKPTVFIAQKQCLTASSIIKHTY